MDKTILLNNRYLIIDKIGEGGMGNVYKVKDTLKNNAVFALKTIKSSVFKKNQDFILQRFKKEFEIMTHLKHPNLVRVFDFVTDSSNNCYIVMEYVPGYPLGKILKENSIKSIDRLMNIIVQMLRALEFIHSRNIIYRDIKPDNILISGNNAKLTDFGISDIDRVEKDKIKGTILFMAPEVLSGNITHLIDIFSLGAVFYQMITGKLFYEGPSYDLTTIIDIMKDEIKFLSIRNKALDEIEGDRLRKIINKMTSFDPGTRYQSCISVISSINELFNKDYPLETMETKESYVLGAPFINRRYELKEMILPLEDNHSHEPSLRIFKGQSGSGKSRLLEEFKKYCQLNDILLIDAYSLKNENKAYGVFVPVLRRIFLYLDRDTIMKYASFLKRIMPHEDMFKNIALTRIQDIKKEREAICEAVVRILYEFITKMNKRSIITIDDIHLADSDSMNICRHLIRSMNDSEYKNSLLRSIYLTISDEKTEILDYSRDHFIDIRPFSREDVKEYISRLFGYRNLDDSLKKKIDDIHQQVGGNPYFLEEVIKILVQKNIIQRKSRLWSLSDYDKDLLKLDHLSSIIEERIRNLGFDKKEREVLSFLSLINIDLNIQDIIEILADHGREFLQSFISELERMEILTSYITEGNVFFRISNNLIKNILLADIKDKIKYHRYIAKKFEDLSSPTVSEYSAEIAFHYSHSKDYKKAVYYYLLSGDKSFKNYMYDIAYKYYDKALSCDPRDEYCDIMLKKAEVLENLQKWEASKNILNEIKDKIRSKDQLRKYYFIRTANYYNLAEYQKALDASNKALRYSEEFYGQDHEETVKVIIHQGTLFFSMGEYTKSLKYFTNALDIMIRMDNTYDITVAELYNDIGVVLWVLGDYNEALKYLEKSLEMKLCLLGEYNPEVSIAYNNLGLIYSKKNAYDKAIYYYKKSMVIIEELFGKRHLSIATELHNIGMIYEKQKKFSRALKYYKESLKIRKYFFNEDSHPEIANSYHNIGSIYIKKGNEEKALYYIKKAKDIWTRYYGEEHVNLAASEYHLAYIHDRLGEYEKAVDHYNRSIVIRKRAYGNDHFEVFAIYFNLADTYFKMKDYGNALKYFCISLDYEQKRENKDYNQIILLHRIIGIVYKKIYDFQKSIQYLEKSFELSKDIKGIKHKDTKELAKIIAKTKEERKNDGK